SAYGVASATIWKGVIMSAAGDYRGAAALMEQAQALAEELGANHVVAGALGAHGRIAHLWEDDARAASLLKQSLAVARESGSQFVIAYAIVGLACVAAGTGQFGPAARLFAAADHAQPGNATFRLTPLARADYERHLAATREALGEAAFAAAWAEGAAMALEQAAEEAEQVVVPAAGGAAAPPAGAPGARAAPGHLH